MTRKWKTIDTGTTTVNVGESPKATRDDRDQDYYIEVETKLGKMRLYNRDPDVLDGLSGDVDVTKKVIEHIEDGDKRLVIELPRADLAYE